MDEEVLNGFEMIDKDDIKNTSSNNNNNNTNNNNNIDTNKRSSLIDDFVISKKELKARRHTIANKLSIKRRMAFDRIVAQGIHGGLENEFKENYHSKKCKLELELNRRLSNRPHPDTLQNDDDIPNDLKKADIYYYKQYGYRNNNGNDIIINDERRNSDVTTQLTKKQKQKIFEMRYSQRMTPDELEYRGIITKNVLITSKDRNIIQNEQKEIINNIKNKLTKKIDLKSRPSRNEMEQRGFTPIGAFDDYENASKKYDEILTNKRQSVKQLKTKLKQRMQPNEAIQRGVIHDGTLNKDYNEIKKSKKKHKKMLSRSLDNLFKKRPDKDDFERNIVNKLMNENYFPNDIPRDVMQFGYDPTQTQIVPYNKNNNNNGNNTLKISMSDEAKNSLNPEYLFGRRELPTTPEDNEIDDTYNVNNSVKNRMKQRKGNNNAVMTPDSDKNIVPAGYFDDEKNRQLESAHERKQSISTELAEFFRNRPDIATVLARGLYKAEFMTMEPEQAKKKMIKDKKNIRNSIKRKLNPKQRLSRSELEQRGYVPNEYFEDPRTSVKQKHRRRLTAEKEITNFLKKRPDPRTMMERGAIKQSQFELITGNKRRNSGPIVEEPDDDETNNNNNNNIGMNNNNQHSTFTGENEEIIQLKQENALLRKQLENNATYNNNNNTSGHQSSSQHLNRTLSQSSGIGAIVYEMPNYNKNAIVVDKENWNQDLYESLLNSMDFLKISNKIKWLINLNLTSNDNNNNNDNDFKNNDDIYFLKDLLTKYEEFERGYHNEMSILQKDKKNVLNKLNEVSREEDYNLKILKELINSHSKIENEITPQLKMIMHKSVLIEQELMIKKNNLILKKELKYYNNYIEQLKQVPINLNNIRNKYKKQIYSCMKAKKIIINELNIVNNKISAHQNTLNDQFIIFKKHIKTFQENMNINKNTNYDTPGNDDSNNDDILFDNNDNEYETKQNNNNEIGSLDVELEKKETKINNYLSLLEFKVSTIPTHDYIKRVFELMQLTFIYNNDKLKSFFEYFIRFSLQYFIEIQFIYEKYKNNINYEIPSNELIQFIAKITSADDLNNKTHYDNKLIKQINIIMLYLNLLPKYEDKDAVVFHVSRYLTADVNTSYQIKKMSLLDIPLFAKKKVKQWIATILLSYKINNIKYVNNNNNNNNNINNDTDIDLNMIQRNLIKITKYDNTARIKPSHTAAIVMDVVYQINVV